MKNSNPVFDSIITGLKEGLEYEKGNLTSVRRRKVTIAPLPKYNSDRIKSIREKLNLTQIIFAKALGVSVKTIEAWENGRNKPNGSAQRILQLLESEDNFLESHQVISV